MSSSDEGDVDQLSRESSSDEEETHEHQADVLESDEDTHLPGELPLGQIGTFSALKLSEMIGENKIELNPSYQRDVVWNDEAMSAVIESYLKNYYVPPVLFRMREDGIFNCIDGKQRLTSLHRFFTGAICCTNSPESTSSSNKTKHWWYKSSADAAKAGGNLIPKRYRKKLEKLEITVQIYDDIREDQEHDIFQRVQYGKALVLAEKLVALQSQWTNYISNELLQKEQKRASQTVMSPFSQLQKDVHMRISRSSDFMAYARICWTLSEIDKKAVIPPLANLWPWAVASAIPTDGSPHITIPDAPFRQRMKDVLEKLQEITENPRLNNEAFCPVNKLTSYRGTSRAKRAINTLSPVEFVCIWVFVARHLDLTPRALAPLIKKFRDIMQQNFAGEKKYNAKVMDKFWEFEQERSLKPRKTGKKNTTAYEDDRELGPSYVRDPDVDMEEDDEDDDGDSGSGGGDGSGGDDDDDEDSPPPAPKSPARKRKMPVRKAGSSKQGAKRARVLSSDGENDDDDDDSS